MAEVINTHTATREERVDSVFIGRGSKWGNPFIIGQDGTRAQVIAKFRAWLDSKPELIEAAKRELPGKSLRCFCSPLPCHGDILLEIANTKGGA